MAHHEISLDDCKSYATEDNLRAALRRLGLDEYKDEETFVPCRFIVTRKRDGRWTAIFLVSEYFRRNKTGGYVGFASQHGFMSV